MIRFVTVHFCSSSESVGLRILPTFTIFISLRLIEYTTLKRKKAQSFRSVFLAHLNLCA